MPIASPPPSPLPTAAPDAADVALRLGARQNGIQTCGWVNADFSNPATCAVGSTCAVNTAYNVHFCCPQFPCTPPTACIGSATACNSDCQSNALILKCTIEGYPACYTRFWSQDPLLSGFGCAPTPLTQTVWTTNLDGKGQTSFVSTFSLAVAAQSGATEGTATPPASTNVAAPTTSTTTSTPSANTGGSSLSPGVIAGIAIGSIVAIVGLMVIWLLLRKQILGGTNRPSKKPKSVDPQFEHGSTHGDSPFEMGNVAQGSESIAEAPLPAHLPPEPQSVLSGHLSPRPETIFSSTSPNARGTIPAVAARPEPVTIPQ